MEKQLHWVKEAFSRDVIILDGEQIIGGMHRDVLAWDVDAHLNQSNLLFNVHGLLKRSVNIHDKQTHRIIGRIEFDWLHSAEVELETGGKYIWKRDGFMMKEWSLLAENSVSETGQEIIHYQQTRMLLADEGDIELLNDSPNADILILTGLFVRNYFLQKRKIAAAH